MTFPNQPWKLATSGDYTCLCPFTISYIKTAASEFAKVLEDRAREKDNHHKAWCKATHNREFLAMPGTTLGSIGHDKFWDFFEALWSVAIAKEVTAGGNGDALRQAKIDTLAEVHAAVIQYTTDHIIMMSGRL